MIQIVPTVVDTSNAEVCEKSAWRIIRDGKHVGYCWKDNPPHVTTIRRGSLSESDLFELAVLLGNKPIVKEPPRVTKKDWLAFQRRIRAS